MAEQSSLPSDNTGRLRLRRLSRWLLLARRGYDVGPAPAVDVREPAWARLSSGCLILYLPLRTACGTACGMVCCNPNVFPWGLQDQRALERRREVPVIAPAPLREDPEVVASVDVVFYAPPPRATRTSPPNSWMCFRTGAAKSDRRHSKAALPQFAGASRNLRNRLRFVSQPSPRV
jgi:hypothetical protein